MQAIAVFSGPIVAQAVTSASGRPASARVPQAVPGPPMTSPQQSKSPQSKKPLPSLSQPSAQAVAVFSGPIVAHAITFAAGRGPASPRSPQAVPGAHATAPQQPKSLP